MPHTPGDWTATDDRRGIWEIIANGEMLAQVWSVSSTGDLPAAANARLMAAAPNLLAALRGFLHADPDVFAAELAAARAAIARAEGAS